jgi:prepilin-type N-terminal cleavage/methylation domain-containing protein
MKHTKSRNGFTLIELIIVMVILGIMAAVAVPRYLDSISNAEKSAEDAVINSIRSGLAQYANNYTIVVELNGQRILLMLYLRNLLVTQQTKQTLMLTESGLSVMIESLTKEQIIADLNGLMIQVPKAEETMLK